MILTALRKVTIRLKAEPFFLITLAATVLLSLISRPQVSSIKWNVIAVLFAQMLVCGAFEDCHLLRSLAQWLLGVFKTPKKLAFAMVLLTGLLSMFITNDVALLTVVPVTLSVAKITGKGPHVLVVLETIAANLFSAVTPFGNPQNLYLFSHYNMPSSDFFSAMLPFGLIGLVLLIIAVAALSRGETFKTEQVRFEICNKPLLAGALAAFAVNILAVLRVIDYRLALLVSVLLFLALAPRLFKSVDYVLLLTFVLFFLLTDALTSIPAVRTFFSGLLASEHKVFFSSAALSQVISNVPAAVVLAGFTPHYKALLYGVSAGGLGTLIASLASLISYKLYSRAFADEKGKFMRWFLLLNLAFLAVLLPVLAALL
jgi:Na+/H+ antiporter NhaD/arsenite permease-like protein